MRSFRWIIAISVIFVAYVDMPMANGQYPSYSDAIKRMERIEEDGGSDISLNVLKINGSAVWTEDRDGILKNIHILEISKGGEAQILVIANLHARECVAAVSALKLGEYLSLYLKDDESKKKVKEEWGKDSRFAYFRQFKEMKAENMLEVATIRIVPIANPDGYYYVRPETDGGQRWRKNRRDNENDPEPQSHGNSDNTQFTGVDLNRNFPSLNSGEEAQQPDGTWVVSRWKLSDLYCGRPKSGQWSLAGPQELIQEREVSGIVEIAKQVNISCLIDLHSYAGSVGWVERPLLSHGLRPNGGFTDQSVFSFLGAKSAALIKDPGGQYYIPEITPYIDEGTITATTGDSLAWIYEKKNCLAFLIEIGKSVQLPSNPDKHADAILPGMLFMMFCAVDNSFSAKPVLKFKKPKQ